ncbi:MAG: hypothetical protein QXI32_03135 [Candidatus Bathyarchaeia archaeon]
MRHSHFCMARASGTKFVDTREKGLYAITSQHLEIATNYYLKAGFKNAVEYGKGTEKREQILKLAEHL